MGQVMGRVRFRDFDQFRETFTTRGAEKRAAHGSRGSRVFRNADDPNEAIVIFDWDRSGVEAFLEDPGMREIMEAAGLEGPPELTHLEEAFEHEA